MWTKRAINKNYKVFCHFELISQKSYILTTIYKEQDLKPAHIVNGLLQWSQKLDITIEHACLIDLNSIKLAFLVTKNLEITLQWQGQFVQSPLEKKSSKLGGKKQSCELSTKFLLKNQWSTDVDQAYHKDIKLLSICNNYVGLKARLLAGLWGVLSTWVSSRQLQPPGS